MLKRIMTAFRTLRPAPARAASVFCSLLLAGSAAYAQEVILTDDFENRWQGETLKDSATSDSRWSWSIHTSSATISADGAANQFANINGESFVSATWASREGAGYLSLDPHRPVELEFDYLNLSGVAENRVFIVDYLMNDRWNNFGAASNTDPVGYRLYFSVADDTTVTYELLNKTGGEWPRVEGSVGSVELAPGIFSPDGSSPGRPVRVLLEIFGNKQKLSFDGVTAFDLDIDPLPQNEIFGSASFIQFWSTYTLPRGIDNVTIRAYDAPPPDPISIAAGELYWANTTTIRTAESNGSGSRTAADGLTRAIGVAVDPVGGHVYWTDQGSVMRAELTGGNPETLVANGSYGTATQGIAVNPTLGKIYWAEYTTGLYSANLDGSNVQQVLSLADYGQVSGSAAVTVDETTGQVYWASVADGTLVRMDHDGSNKTTVAVLGTNPYGLAFDSDQNRMYFTRYRTSGDLPNGTLSVIDLGVEAPVAATILEGLGDPLGLALTADGAGLYWAERTGGKIRGIRVTETGFEDAQTLRSFEISPFGLAAMPTATAPEPPPAKRRLFVYEGFDYPAGDLVGQDSGFGWAESWTQSVESGTARPLALVASPGLTFGDLVTTGNKAQVSDERRAFRSIDTSLISAEQLDDNGNLGIPGTRLWASFLAEGLTAEPTDGFWGLSFFRDDSETLFFGKSATSGVLRLSGQGQLAQEFADALSPTDKHWIVLRFDFNADGDDTVTLFHNLDPMQRTPSDEEALGTFSAADFSFNRFRLANSGGPGGTIDELRVGATWAEVSPVPFTGLVNGTFEDEPFDRGWSVRVGGIVEHAPIAPGSNTAVFIPSGGSSTNPIRLVQYLPQWIELSGAPLPSNPPALDPVTGERFADHFIPTGPQWQFGFHTAVADPGAAGNRSLNMVLGHAPSEEYANSNLPVINFRINGLGEGQAYSSIAPTGWKTLLPAGTFVPSTLTNGAFVDPTAYYVQFNGDYSTENPSYTVSVRRVGEDEFFAVSAPASYWQYEAPPAGSGITMVHYHGYVNAPYLIDDVHLMTVGASDGFAAWRENYFNSAELADPSISGLDADADGDGIPTLLEYALGLNPRQASGARLPATGVVEIGGEMYLTLTYTRPAGISDLGYHVEVSGDLSGWAGGPVEVSSLDNGDDTVSVTYRDAEPIGAAGSRFLRLRVAAE